MQKVFVRSKKNALIDVHTQVRLPRTFRRFCGLFAQLLQKLSVRSTNSKERMLKARHLAISKWVMCGGAKNCRRDDLDTRLSHVEHNMCMLTGWMLLLG